MLNKLLIQVEKSRVFKVFSWLRLGTLSEFMDCQNFAFILELVSHAYVNLVSFPVNVKIISVCVFASLQLRRMQG